MVFFITFLRALAACFITNAHYTGIYPTDLISNGGLIGDILFFAVSGYCLCNVRMSFLPWYGKRIYRVYIPVIIITVLYLVFGYYTFEEHNLFGWLVYPTAYHFVASIILLYIPFYVVMKVKPLRNNLGLVIGTCFVLYMAIYILVYDKSYYHIDNVHEPMIRFLFMECMLLGAWFKQNDKKFRNKFKFRYLITAIVLFMVYFASKLLLSHRESVAPFQIVNQIVIFMLLFFMFCSFAGLDSRLEYLPVAVKKIIEFISSITLEIYVVQYYLIEAIRPIGRFPINWILLTAAIILSAFLLNRICKLIYSLIDTCKNKCVGR